MKITKVLISNLFGIKEISLNEKSVELTGSNGVGKTSVIDAIKYALRNKSDKKYIIKEGNSEGEIVVQTDTGLSIKRKPRLEKTDYVSIREAGSKDDKNEGFLREIFTELQLNPIEFSQMTEQEQNRIILDLIDFKWDLNWIKEQFGEIPQGVNYQQNILNVLNDIQHKEGFYFKKREELNRLVRHQTTHIAEIAETLPNDYTSEKWKKEDLSHHYKTLETARLENMKIQRSKDIVKNKDNKIRSFQADYEIACSSIDKDFSFNRNNIEKEIAELKNKILLLEKDLNSLEIKKLNLLEIEKSNYEKNVALFEGEVKEHIETSKKELIDVSIYEQTAQHVERMKSHINEYDRMVSMQNENKMMIEQSNELTNKIELARSLPAKILEQCNIPIEGLSIKDGIPLINGLPISNLSEGEKFELCINVASRNKASLNLLLLDGVEKLSTERREAMYKKLKDKGVQFIATRTTDEESLTITEI
ncbi:hypothetical protein EKK58_10240 [Candidatus Dependentiae bacterium]|nr:MAG: hypothetical protein EKK58_10240 [Candidatus Dependentiae bacterium]